MSELKIIAHIRTDFPEKFGIPRQSGLIEDLVGRIVFEPEYRSEDAFRGIEGYDYLWLLWAFEGTERGHFSATVTPPKLGGNRTMGVFATRSPFRPNPIGLSSVRLERLEHTENGPVLVVSGADLRDNTPIYDIKPYLAYTDSHPDAREALPDASMIKHCPWSFRRSLRQCFQESKRKSRACRACRRSTACLSRRRTPLWRFLCRI